jgi:hypothetical protein
MNNLTELQVYTERVPDADELRKWAAWYREFAERTGNPTIWEMRLRTAEKLEAEADRIEYLNSFPSGTKQLAQKGSPHDLSKFVR